MGRIGRVTEVRRKEREVVIEDMNLVSFYFVSHMAGGVAFLRNFVCAGWQSCFLGCVSVI